MNMIIFPITEIVHVHDGDTLWVRRRWQVGDDGDGTLWKEDYAGGVSVRLTNDTTGLDTPELNSKDPAVKAKALQATQDLQQLVDLMSGCALELAWTGKMSFDRFVGDIRISGSTYGLTAGMLAKGWAPWKK